MTENWEEVTRGQCRAMRLVAVAEMKRLGICGKVKVGTALKCCCWATRTTASHSGSMLLWRHSSSQGMDAKDPKAVESSPSKSPPLDYGRDPSQRSHRALTSSHIEMCSRTTTTRRRQHRLQLSAFSFNERPPISHRHAQLHDITRNQPTDLPLRRFDCSNSAPKLAARSGHPPASQSCPRQCDLALCLRRTSWSGPCIRET